MTSPFLARARLSRLLTCLPFLIAGSVTAAPVALTEAWQQVHELMKGDTVEISVRVDRPSQLPVNGRVAVEWQAPKDAQAAASWRKVLHALDGDLYLVYRAPVAGKYTLKLAPVVDEEPIGASGPRWREKGSVPNLVPLPKNTPWPKGTAAAMTVNVTPLDIDANEEASQRTFLEVEPNDVPELAQTIELTPPAGNDVRTWEILGGADDIEFFDNGKVGQSGEDWYRLEYKGTEPRLLTAQLSMPIPTIAHRIRCYTSDKSNKKAADVPGALPLSEYREGSDPNERVHQQDESHRANICRTLKPGQTYFLRVEANAPGYQLQLRLLKAGPYDDPRLAIRQGMYTQIGQVDAWLTNRPRGASLDRRIRDTGNLLGTNCMSCHTQSGVWGPAVPLAQGYRLENVQNFWHLRNVMYECLRPTNELKDAANNTSLAPLDLGDGPAGTRAAGFNIVNAERVLAAPKLHSAMQTRTANFVLQTGDPGGINAAGPGSNVGQVVVLLFASEILQTAWQRSASPKYFRALEEKARRVLAVQPKFTDDIALRLDYFHRVFPIAKYEQELSKAADLDKKAGDAKATAKFIADVKKRIAEDEEHLVRIQNGDGSWGFNPDGNVAPGKEKSKNEAADPAPTALAITGLTSAGRGKDDPVVAKAVRALLKMQEPTGRWNKSAQTGFVTSAYVMHALSRLYPAAAPTDEAVSDASKSLPGIVRTTRQQALHGDAKAIPHLLEAARHASPAVRHWAMIGLGAQRAEAGLPALKSGLADPVRMVREAAVWGFRQTLLEDHGWDMVYDLAAHGDDYTRESLMQALNMRADAVLSGSKVDWQKLGKVFDHAFTEDTHPAVRAWSAKAAWQWWVWNPPIRLAINKSWARLIETPETNALVENSNRYSSQALFIANGHRGNGSGSHQYKELADLIDRVNNRLDNAEPELRTRMVRRLVGIAATFAPLSGGDGGPGQMGYTTPGAGLLFGRAVLSYLETTTPQNDLGVIRLGLEAATSVPDRELADFVINYSLKGPESLREQAARAVSDPRLVKLPAVPEQVEPQLAQVMRGALEPARRPQVSDPILKLWSKVSWVVPTTEEQQRNFFNLMIPKFDRYLTPKAIADIADPAKRAEAEKQLAASWYLADGIGDVLATNPDLRHDLVFRRYFPAKVSNPVETHFWIRSIGWMLTHKGKGEIKKKPIDPTDKADEDLTIKDRALQLYLDQLRPEAEPATRALAIKMSNQTALRRNPEVLTALGKIVQFEKSAELKQIATNVLKQGTEKFMPELLDALRKDKDASVRFASDGTPQPTKEQLDDVIYFRDYVMPELVRQKREDSKSCLACHGVPGRVPSFTLMPADEFGFISTADLLTNYRLMQKRVDLTDLEKSKVLRKPLNIENAQEDGHQGGRRYAPTDEGYLLLKRWVESQPAVQKRKE